MSDDKNLEVKVVNFETQEEFDAFIAKRDRKHAENGEKVVTIRSTAQLETDDRIPPDARKVIKEAIGQMIGPDGPLLLVDDDESDGESGMAVQYGGMAVQYGGVKGLLFGDKIKDLVEKLENLRDEIDQGRSLSESSGGDESSSGDASRCWSNRCAEIIADVVQSCIAHNENSHGMGRTESHVWALTNGIPILVGSAIKRATYDALEEFSPANGNDEEQHKAHIAGLLNSIFTNMGQAFDQAKDACMKVAEEEYGINVDAIADDKKTKH